MPRYFTSSQFKRMADTLNGLGLAAVIGGVGDVVVSGTRQSVDRLGIVSGAVLLLLSVWLSRWENDDVHEASGLTRSARRR